MKKIILTLILLLSVSTLHARDKYTPIVNSWVGHTISDLTDSWGYPTRNFVNGEGNNIYAYEKSQQYITPTFQMPSNSMTNTYNYRYMNGSIATTNTNNGVMIGGQVLMLTCNTYFEINQDNVIVGGSWQGNSCK